MNKILVFIVSVTMLLGAKCGKDGGGDTTPVDSVQINYPLPFNSMRARDPFILVDKEVYYLVVNNNPSFKVYSSKNLVNWRDEGNVFNAPAGFWGTKDFWAPDVYMYNGKYYLFATFSGNTAKRGTSILVADKPTGPYQPLVNQAATPANWMCLDGSLYVDPAGTPWILYCHEWLEVTDGQIVAQQLSPDLKTLVGDPKVLFTGSSAPWTGTITASGVTGYVTDAPFIYKAKNGELLMLWSSFAKNGKYAIGVARSESGTLLGPWKQDAQPLNSDDGGHAMLFTGVDGKLRISYHSPNSVSEKPVLYEVVEDNGKLSLK